MNSNFLIFGASGLIGGHFKEACENNEKEFISIGRRYLPKSIPISSALLILIHLNLCLSLKVVLSV